MSMDLPILNIRLTTVVDLAGMQGRNPPLLALKADDVLAFSSWDDANKFISDMRWHCH